MTPIVVSATLLRKRFQQVLQANLPTALVDIAELEDVDPITPPKAWRRLPDFRKLLDDQSPTVIVTTPGLSGTPGEGQEARLSNAVEARWDIRTFCIVRAGTYDAVADMVGWYTAAIRLAALRNKQLSGLARTTRWVGEAYDLLDASDARTIGAGSVDFTVGVDNAVDPAAT